MYNLTSNVFSGHPYELYQSYVFVKPWTRAVSYLIGIATYYFLLFMQNKIRQKQYVGTEPLFPRSAQAIATLLAALLVFLSIFAPYQDYSSGEPDWSQMSNVLYITFSPALYSVGLAIILIFCLVNQGGVFEFIFSASFWRPLAKLSLGVAILHPLIIQTIYYSSGDLMYYQDIVAVYYFIPNVILAYGAAYVAYVCFEYPCCQLDKYFFERFRSNT